MKEKTAMRMNQLFPGLAVIFLWLSMASLAQAADRLPDFTDLAADNSPAVVNISTTREIKQQFKIPEGMEIPDDVPFREFFRHFFEDMPQKQFETTSLGSGFIISRDGYVLTNHHVVADAEEVMVRLSDRREFVARIVGSDERSDIALLKIDAEDLPAVRIGDSEDLEVGEWVLAIGSPFGFDYSVTAGIVSAKGRSLPTERNETYVPFIQTDVAINPGNSGGPLFNMEGEVVGVNSQIYSQTGGFMGLSFAIPIDVVMDVVEQIKTQGHVTRGYLGVMIQEVTRELAEPFGLERPTGALVSRVLPDGPAEKAGIEAGDVILEFGGQAVTSSAKLPAIVGSYKPSEQGDVRIIRDGRERELTVKVGELPAVEETRSASRTNGASSERVGLEVETPSPQVRDSQGIESGGVQVTAVEPGSPAAQAGIRKGDLIVRVGRQDVQGVEDFARRLEEAPRGDTVAVLVRREGNPLFLALRMPDG